VRGISEVPQQTGVLFMSRQQVQPASSMQDMQSQQAWIISQHLGSPLVQVMQTPSLVISHLHMPIVKLQQQTIMPFIIMQQLHMPPASMRQRFCTMPQATLSSQEQTIFIPPEHFSIFRVQRGTIIQFGATGIAVGAPGMGVPIPGTLIPCIAIPARSITVAMLHSFLGQTLPRPDAWREVHGTRPPGRRDGVIIRSSCNGCNDYLAWNRHFYDESALANGRH